ncbi:integrase [Escherichia coli]|uniref:Integrase n=2 Tax=Citrobacter TaxID=544 RepID=A0AA44SHM6_CITFR|nr:MULTISPECIES: integrase [Enterobacteriaceae]EFD0290681.1 integrase [Escherichia coli]HDL7346798.1 integrase [Yersinia enterocolitica]EME0770217.1 integrase [Escherichia coli]MBA8031210.1 integrase [Citrobacter freundii]MCV4523513.1 integrase [Escherichia coli]
MAEIFQFKPKATLTAEENLRVFISKCRDQLTVFGSDLNWGAPVWPNIIVFAKLGMTTRKPTQGEVQDPAFIDFAKAYFRYQQGHHPTGAKNESKAFRTVEAALLQVNGNANINGLSISVLDEAAELARQHYSDGSAYHCGREIERLAKFVVENQLVSCAVQNWVNPIKRADDKNKTGREANKNREEKLPSDIALNALAEIFANDPIDGRDIFTTSVFAMLMSAPSRISEVLALPADCEVFETDRDGIERYGWRFFAGKGYEGDIKWIPTVMVSVAKTAVARIKMLTENARQLAKWIESHPNRFYRHANCPDVADDEPLTAEQSCMALGLVSESKKQCRSSLYNRGLAHKDRVHTLRSLWEHTLARLPDDFPWFDKDKGIKYSNALFALNANQFHGNRGCLPVELHKPTNNFFNSDLTPRLALKGKHTSIFDRHRYHVVNGEPVKLTSHQARHLLNTIAQRGGLSNLEIAKWSGRADVKQNRTYNHMTEYELVGMAERLDSSKALFGPAGEVAKHFPVTMLEFNTLEHAAVHVTEYGYCVHDYTIGPCEKFRDCINCNEQVCIKGEDTEILDRIKKRLVTLEQMLCIADEAVESGEMGADRWYQYHKKTVTRLRELVAILENPDIENGAQIKLRGNDFSQLRRVVAKTSIVVIEQKGKESEEAVMLDDLKTLLGGGLG